MIVWGGCDAQTCGPGGNSDRNGLNNGGRYNPRTDTWQAISLNNAPQGRWNHRIIWTGSEMIAWGGVNGFMFHNSGGRYNPQTDTWTLTSLTNALVGRELPGLVWTGSRMLAWGGGDSNGSVNTGGAYNPAADSWTTISATNAPAARNGLSAIWTGNEMVVWGGCTGVNCSIGLDTGGRYNPETNAWRTMSTIEAPSGRDLHTAVWAGSEMIVFGGESCARCEPVLDTGGRYSIAGPPVATAANSRKTHGTAGAFDIALPLTGTAGIEPRTGGATGDHQLVITFNTPVTLSGNPQAQVTSGAGAIGSNGTANGGVVLVNGTTVTIPLTNAANAQTINVTLSGVTNANGSINLTLPVSFLLGDTNGDGMVNASDAVQTRNRSGQVVDPTNFRTDVNVDGSINTADATIVRNRSGSSLP